MIAQAAPGETPGMPRPSSFCENGVKAVAWKATSRRCTPDFFATHTVSDLAEKYGHFLERQGRLTHPMRYDAGTDHYVPVTWDDVFTLIAEELTTSKTQTKLSSTPPGAHPTKRLSFGSCSSALMAPTTCPTVPICATKRPAWR